MIRGIHFEVLLALTYSLFLGGVAFAGVSGAPNAKKVRRLSKLRVHLFS